jgi:AraC-like DNA-binding protein
MWNEIESLDLYYKDFPASFVFKTMEEIEEANGGAPDKPHRHNYYTVIWSYNATGKHIIDFNEYRIEPQHIFFVSPGQVHQVISNPNSTGVVILFTSEFLQKNSIREDFISNLRLFHNSDETPPLPLNESMAKKLRIFADAMNETFKSSADMKLDTLGAYLKLFLIECNNHCSLYPSENSQSIEVGRSLVQNFKNLVEIHFRTLHLVKDYADLLHVTPGYLNEVIKEAIGKPAKNYIQNRIILEAKRMLTFTNKNLKEIGYDLGFEDPSHFSKFFKAYTGISFAEFKVI